MHQRIVWVLAGVLFLILSGPAWALHPFYEQNGDAYLLIGDGPQRGVYALHNLTGGGVARLYDPLDAYGITAEQVWLSGASNKRLYTFGADPETGWTPVSGTLSRNVILNATNNVYDASTIPPLIVHRYHGSPFNSPTGRGNHPQGTLDWKFSGFDYPCKQVPPPDPARPGYSLVDVGRFYHAFDHPVQSPYVYGGWSSPGFWCHWVLRENVEACYRNMKLYRYLVNTNSGPTIIQNIANVKTRQRSSMDKRGECVDGCITQADNIPLPGGETPYLDCVYSTLGRSYLYQREPSQSLYTLTGFSGTDVLIGNPSNLTTQYVGISSKDTTGNWVYTLGKDQINAWLAAANAPFTVASLSDVAVSDQWWQTGGLVYAYDRTQKKVYQFARNEVSGAVAIPTSISVWDGQSVPDSISADGFGNLYMVRTDYEPDGNPPTFAPTDAYNYYNTWAGYPYYRAQFRQYVYKAVTRRDYYSGAFSTVPGRVLLGINEFYRDFTSNTPANKATWNWIGAQTRLGPIVQTEYRTEMSVLNNATPPKVTGNRNGVVDIYGPLDNNLNMVTGTGPGLNEYDDTQTYFFAVENFPAADTNGVNIGSTGIDKDSDSIIGEFPSTTKIPSVKYYWKIIQTKDRYGVDVTNTILDQESTGAFSTSPILPVTLAGGHYRVGVKAKFKFYDYDLLPLGALSDQKETVLTNEITGSTPGSGDSYAWNTFIVRTVPLVTFPGGRGVIMSGLPLNIPATPVLYPSNDLRAYKFRPGSPWDANNSVVQCSTTDQNPVGAKFVVPETGIINGRWAIQLRESTYNLNRTGDPNRDRLEVMQRVNPPDPADPRMVPGTLRWMGAAAFNWTCTLKRGVEGITDKTVTTSVPYFFFDKVKELMPIPSQPRAYGLQVRAVRVYQYDTFTPITFYVSGEVVTNWIRITKPVTIQIAADCEFVMTDETPPALAFPDPFNPTGTLRAFFSQTSDLWGSTGEALGSAEGKTNPTWLEYVVADNNPMGNDPGDATINSYADRFHAIAVNHVPSHRVGRFHYTTANRGIIPPATATAQMNGPATASLAVTYSSYDQALVNFCNSQGWTGTAAPGNFKVTARDLVEADFNAGWLAALRPDYNKALSYRLYRIQRDDLQHFSFTTTGLNSPEMDLSFANNSPGYQNLGYGLEWSEASGFGIGRQRNGRIVIRDNDRPNIFVRAQELKNEGAVYYAPKNVVDIAGAFGQWRRFANAPTNEYLHNGVLGWDTPSIQGFDPVFHVSALPITNELIATAEIEVDVPVFFYPSILDNAGGIATLAFRLLDVDGSTVMQDVTASGKVLRHIFRKPGVYTLRVQAEDLALGWPTNPANPVTTAVNNRNRRNFECKINVVATRLDVRVIDRSFQGK